MYFPYCYTQDDPKYREEELDEPTDEDLRSDQNTADRQEKEMFDE